MKRILIIFVLLIHFGNSYSQNGFYFSPILQKKCPTTNIQPWTIITPQNLTIEIKPKNVYLNPGLDGGILFGYRNKNYFFETGWLQDQSGQGFNLNMTAYDNYSGLDSGYWNIQKFDYTSIMFNKYPVRFGLKIAGSDSVKHNKKIKWNLFLLGGVDFFSRPPVGIKSGSTSISYVNPQLDSIIIDEDFINIGRRYFIYTVGLSLKGYNKKGQNIINFGINFSQGRRFEYMSGTKLVITNVDGYQYRQYLYSKGSGFYFTLSKDINPLYKKQRKIKELQNDYKN